MQMGICGVKSQWMKRIVLQRLLPKKVAKNVKGLLSKSKTEAGNTIYKDIKDRLLQIMGPKEQDLYRKASSLVMVDTPSQLARSMVDLLCKCGPNSLLNGCCGETIISGMWRDKLPDPVRAAVASLKLSGTNFETTIRNADDVFLALNASKVQVSADTETRCLHSQHSSCSLYSRPKPKGPL